MIPISSVWIIIVITITMTLLTKQWKAFKTRVTQYQKTVVVSNPNSIGTLIALLLFIRYYTKVFRFNVYIFISVPITVLPSTTQSELTKRT